MKRAFRSALAGRAAVAAALPFFVFSHHGSPSVQAHDWYDEECCSGEDCAPAKEGEVVRTPDGWLIIPLNITVPFARARVSADDHFHYCRYRTGKGSLIIPFPGKPCLYVPSRAM